jgi:hypothetical protein
MFLHTGLCTSYFQQELKDNGLDLPDEQINVVVSFLRSEAFDCMEDLAGTPVLCEWYCIGNLLHRRGGRCRQDALLMDVRRNAIAETAGGICLHRPLCYLRMPLGTAL